MQGILAESLKRLKQTRLRKMRMVAIILALSLVVSLDVFWILRQPGLTLAGDADCKITEHTHDDICQSAETPCAQPEHVHTIDCYCDETANAETQLDWQKMFADFPYTGILREDLVGIAKTQVGYSESTRNFQVDSNGNRQGYSRYGAWYGLPYNDWSAMFVSFCLHYAGADPEVFPSNIGAASMAELWKQRQIYKNVGEYTPAAGDVVFFQGNAAGIVTEVYGNTFYVIRGDVDGTVTSQMLSLTDESILGWGVTEETVFEQQSSLTYTMTSNSSNTLTDYLEANGGNYFFTLQDQDGHLLEKNDGGQYEVQVGSVYQLTFTFNSPNGIPPGTYEYQLPSGFSVANGTGDFIIKPSEDDEGIHVGSWSVSDSNKITMTFNDNINDLTEVILSAVMKVHFPEQEEPIEFDGNITVTVEKPPTISYPTLITKFGFQGGNPNSYGTDPTKIFWTIYMYGQQDSQIPGSTLTDVLMDREWSYPHTFTESDIANGITLGVTDPSGEWHSCWIPPDDPNLTWDETGFTYIMPTTMRCWCGEVTLGNAGWEYYIQYSSTPTPTGMAGSLGYENGSWIDGQYSEFWTDFVHAEVPAEVRKTGTLRSDAGGSKYHWEIQVDIPGWAAGAKADYHWYMLDSMHLLDDKGADVSPVENDANLSTVTVDYNGTILNVPEIHSATENDRFAWENAWSDVIDGINYHREINLLCRCNCTADNCKLWESNGCGSMQGWYEGSKWHSTGFCQCWTAPVNTTFTFAYETDAVPFLENFGGIGYKVENAIDLYYKPSKGADGIRVSSMLAEVPIPGVFKKELGHSFDGYTANYKITINEAKVTLTDGSPLTIHDVMSDTLAYISGSLVITTEDANGNIAKLALGSDYTVTYDGTGTQKDEAGNEVHVLDIVILHPQPVQYLLDYDTTLIVPKNVTESIKYNNSATITLWGEDFKDNSTEMGHANINIAAKSYKVSVIKSCAVSGEPLSGATYGLFNAYDGLIATAVSDENGTLLFQTNVVEGVILREKTLYYVQELEAPPGYLLDNAKHWFCFCANSGPTCETCDALIAKTDAFRIPNEQVGKIYATNQIINYDLPSTGGPGDSPLILVSVTLIITPLVYMSIRRRKREGRGVG